LAITRAIKGVTPHPLISPLLLTVGISLISAVLYALVPFWRWRV
jgi:hypothetical protein